MPTIKQRPGTLWRFDRVTFWKAIEGRLSVEGMTYRDAAPGIGIGYSTLWRISRHMPDVDTVVKVCQWLRTSVDSFVVKGEESK
jgi:hypothetical protein